MPRVTDNYRTARREEIIAAALRAFHRGGFHATSMADVIAESGLSAGAIYGHFASKSDLVLGVANKVIGSRIHDIEELLTRDTLVPPAGLLRVLMAGMLRDLGNPGVILQLWGEAVTTPEIRELTTAVFGQLQGTYRTYLTTWHQQEHGLPHAEAHQLADEQVALFLSAAQGYMVQSALLPGFDDEQYLTTVEKYLPR